MPFRFSLVIDVPRDVHGYHKECPIRHTLLSFCISDGYDSAAIGYVCRSLKSINNLVCQVISSGGTKTFGYKAVNSEDALVINLWVKSSYSRLSHRRD